MEESGFGFQMEQEIFLLHIVQTGSGVHPLSYVNGTVGLSS
jgi:hypothetical protein